MSLVIFGSSKIVYKSNLSILIMWESVGYNAIEVKLCI